MNSCEQALEAYFSARNENWLTPDAELFRKVVERKTTPKWLDRVVHQAKQKLRSYAYADKTLVRAHSKIDILVIQLSSDGHFANITAVEQICWAYQDRTHPAVECRLIYHRQTWCCIEDKWILKNARETRDGKSFLEEDQKPTEFVQPKWPQRDTMGQHYDRVRATRYADVWWDDFNPRYPKLPDDCTNFISQCLHAGDLPMKERGDRVNGWWVDKANSAGSWSYSWTTAHALFQFLKKHHSIEQVRQASELKMGDLIFYDWDGSGVYHHSTIVTDFDDRKDPLVNAHTEPSFHRPFAYRDSRAWTPKTRYAFVHMPNGL